MENNDIVVINDIIESPNSALQSIFNYYNATNDENKEFVFNILTSFVNNELNENGTELFIVQYFTSIQTTNFDEMVKMWVLSLETIYTTGQIHELLINLLRTIIAIGTSQESILGKEFTKIMTKKIWSYDTFRKSIKDCKKYDTGFDYTFNGIFLSLFQKMSWVDPLSLLVSVDPLVHDESIHEYLIDYIYDIIQLNLPYTYDNMQLVDQKKCSSMHFNTFLLKILIKLVKHYSLQTMNDFILSGDKYIAKSYSIANLPFFHKLMIVTLQAIAVFHTPVIKAHYYLTGELSHVTNIFSFVNNQTTKRDLELKMKRVNELLTDNDNAFIQHLYINYQIIYKKIYIDEIYNDIMVYIDYATSFGINDKFYGTINKNIYKYVSNVMGGFFGYVTNIHVRHYASELMEKLLPIEGFDMFGDIDTLIKNENMYHNNVSNVSYDSVFNNLFKFISEVDFFKWTSLPKAIIHQKKILETLIMLLDYPVKFSQNRRSVIAGTIFNILKRGIYLFDSFTDLCNSIQNNILMIRELQSVNTDMIDCIILSLTFHRTIYNKQIVSTIYPEVEEKYIIFINKLIHESSNINHPIYSVIRRPDMAAQLTHLSYASIYEHIKMAPEFVNKIKNILQTYLHYSGLSADEKTLLFDQLESFVENNIEYPEELLDPLSCTTIFDPVKIPNIDEIFDRSTILTHIFESYPDPTNPYTREPLTIEMFDEYNERLEIKNDIAAFLEKKKQFESANATN